MIGRDIAASTRACPLSFFMWSSLLYESDFLQWRGAGIHQVVVIREGHIRGHGQLPGDNCTGGPVLCTIVVESNGCGRCVDDPDQILGTAPELDLHRAGRRSSTAST